MEKPCEVCGTSMRKKPKESSTQWENRAFCTHSCANKMKKGLAPHLYFWKYADRKGDNDCWGWSGTVDQHGYGRVAFMTSIFKAHRIAYEMFHGPIPNGAVICHKCDNPNCVNPNHLFAGTQKDNMQDASRKNRLNPASMLNLRPGQKGRVGAGDKSNKDIQNERKR